MALFHSYKIRDNKLLFCFIHIKQLYSGLQLMFNILVINNQTSCNFSQGYNGFDGNFSVRPYITQYIPQHMVCNQ